MPSPRFLAKAARGAEWQAHPLTQGATGLAGHDHQASSPRDSFLEDVVPVIPPVRVPHPSSKPSEPNSSEAHLYMDELERNFSEQVQLALASVAELLRSRMDALEKSLQEIVQCSVEGALARTLSRTGGAAAHRDEAAIMKSGFERVHVDSPKTVQTLQSALDLISARPPSGVDALRTSPHPCKTEHDQSDGVLKASHHLKAADANGSMGVSENSKLSSDTLAGGTTLWPVWSSAHAVSEEKAMDIGVRIRLKEMRKLRGLLSRDMTIGADQAKPTGSPCYVFLSGFVMHPSATPIMIWLSLCPFWILYDVVLIPMSAMPLPDLVALRVVYIVCAVYWTADLVRLFFTGYEHELDVEMRLSHIVVRYLRTWFILDFLSVFLDWVFISIGVNGLFNKFWRSHRAFRSFHLLRIFRLVRVMKFVTHYRQIHDRLHSIKTLLLMKSVLVFFSVMLFLHYNGCYWYSLGDQYLIIDRVTGHQKVTWLTSAGIQDMRIADIYITAIQWSLAQGGFSSTNIYPTNTFEHIYACFTGFLWLVIVSICIALYSKWLHQIREANRDFDRGTNDLRTLLYQHAVPRNLMFKILRCYNASYKLQMRQTHEQDIEFMKSLPDTLKISLRREIFLPTLHKHTFFRILGSVDCELLTAVSHLAMHEQHVSAGEPAFLEGEAAKHMLYISSGLLEYYSVCAEDNNRLISKIIKAGDWACEPALCLQWRHHGRLMATSSCEVVLINVTTVHAIAEECERGGANLYAVRNFFADVSQHFLSDAKKSDLWGDQDAIGRIEQAHFGPTLAGRKSASWVSFLGIW